MPAIVHVSFPAEGVAQLLMETGPRNFMTWELNERLDEALMRARDSGARVVILGSAVDGYFLAHGSLADNIATFTGNKASGEPTVGRRVLRELDTGPMVSIAAVDGQAWGGGAELAWACDLRVASERATFAQPEVNIGVVPGAGGTVRLARIAGEAACLRMVLDGRPVDAQEAYRLGMVHRVVPGGTVLGEALEWAKWLASRPAWALEANKRALTGARDMPLLDGLKHEGRIYVEQFSKPEALELARAAEAAYERGADSYEAFGIPREDADR
jgi:enoyl-CoA hydratase